MSYIQGEREYYTNLRCNRFVLALQFSGRLAGRRIARLSSCRGPSEALLMRYKMARSPSVRSSRPNRTRNISESPVRRSPGNRSTKWLFVGRVPAVHHPSGEGYISNVRVRHDACKPVLQAKTVRRACDEFKTGSMLI